MRIERMRDRPSSRFSIGDRVRVKYPGSPWHGTETTVESNLVLGRMASGAHVWVHIVAIAVEPQDAALGVMGYAFRPCELEPVGDDGAVGSWSDIERITGWSPARESA